uniref:Uncharacterized protein n=1 Tax=Fagus sylvatica TaxID=28930 RepID=A0A2N9FCN2_FAGSY
MCCVALGSELYFFGGEYNIDDPCIDEDVKKKYKKVKRDSFPRDVYIFDPDEKVLKLHGQKMNSGKSWPWAFVAKEKIYVIGSNFTTDISNTSTMKNLELKKLAWFEVYEPKDSKWKWTTLPNPPIGNEGTRWVGHAVVGMMALLVARQRGKEHLYCFDLDKGRWTKRVSHPSQLCNFSGRTEYVEDTFYGCYHNIVAAIAPVADKELKEEEDMGASFKNYRLHLVSGEKDMDMDYIFNVPQQLGSSSSLIHLGDRSFCYVMTGMPLYPTNGSDHAIEADKISIMVPKNMVYGSLEKRKEAGPSTPPSGPRRITQRSIANSVTERFVAAAPAAADDGGDDHKTIRSNQICGRQKPSAQSPSYTLSNLSLLYFSENPQAKVNFSIRADLKSSRNTVNPTTVHGTLPPGGLKNTRGNAPSATKWSTTLGVEFWAQHPPHTNPARVQPSRGLPCHGRDTRPGWWTDAHPGGGQTHGGENPFGGGQALGGGQVLGGGEIPVGGPQQMALMFEMIKGMQQNQVELAESLRQLREANGNKEDHQNKNDNRNHEEEGKRGVPWNISVSFWIPWDPLLHMVISVCGSSRNPLVDRAYTWYTVLPAGSIRTWEDMVEELLQQSISMLKKRSLLVNFYMAPSSRPGEDLVKLSLCPPQPHLAVPNERIQQDKAYEEPPPLPFTAEEMMAIFDKWVQDQVIKLPKISKQPTAEEQKDPKYCRYHRYKKQQKVHQTPFPNYNKGKGKAVVSVVIHGNVSDMEAEESAAATGISDLRQEMQQQKHFITIAAESGATCFTAEAHASRAFLETTNAITFTDEDMEVQYPDHRRPFYLSAVVKDVQKIQGSPMEVTGFGGVTEYTMGHVQLVLKVGPIVALTRFHVVNAETPYHVLLGRPWLHKHKLVSSTYHQCVKGRLNGKPIHIAANSCPFDQTEAHFVEAALYDDLASTGEPSIVRPCGTPLPAWEDIKDDPEIDLRELLERKKKRKEREVEHGSPPQCMRVQLPDGRISTVMNPQEVAVDQTESMAINSERPAVDQTESMAMNSKEVAEDQTESTVMRSWRIYGGPCTVYGDEFWKKKLCKPISISKSLSAKERKCLIDLLHEYKDVFAWDYHEMPGIDPGLVAHSLNVEPGTRPVVQPMRTFHTEVEAQITQEVKKLLAAGFIKPIQHPRWLSNIDEFPLPNMDLLIDSAAGHAMFSFMDGFSGYNQIRMSTKDAEKTAFRTPIGNFYYTVMPFGLKNAVVKSKKREDHLGILRKVFDRCRLYKLKMNPLKCAFGVSAGKFLGFLVHNRGIDVDPAKASAIATMKAPTSHKELKSFLGRLSYIRRFIPGLAAVTAVFTPLMKKGVPFVWSTACQQAFEKIQVIMTKLPTGEDSSSISHEVPGEIGEALLADLVDSTWTLKFDGSSTSNSSGAGIVLIREDGETIAKSFKLDFSCSNNASEYEAYITGLAIAHEMGIKHLRVIGDSNLIICQTKGEFSLKEPSLALYRALAQKLEEKFDTFEISHAMRCEENRYADALATLGSQVSFEGSKVDVTIDKRSMPITDLLREKFKEQNLDAEDWRTPIKAKLHTAWRSLSKMCEPPRGSKEINRRSTRSAANSEMGDWRTPFLEYLIENILPQTSQAAIRIKKLATRYFVEGGILFRKGFHGDPLRCLSLAESQTVMKEAHSGECGEHQGKKRLYQLLLTLGYYWPTMKKDTADFVKSCHTCQLQANLIHTHPTSLQNMATPWPFHTWGLDLIGPINPSSGGYIWILVATEYFSKWVEAIPLRKATGAAVANFIREHIITRFGIPHKIISDNGTPFVNKNVREVLEHYRIKHRRSTPYYPQGNGQAEATNRMLLRILSKMVFDYGKGWSSHLADTLWAYRGSTKTATGFTPFSLVYGTDAISPTELLVPSPRILHGMDLEADADICAEARVADLERIFAKGQMVLRTVDHVRRGLPSPSKFAPNWEGPYLIREAYDSGYYKLSTADGTTLVDPINGKWLKRYYS